MKNKENLLKIAIENAVKSAYPDGFYGETTTVIILDQAGLSIESTDFKLISTLDNDTELKKLTDNTYGYGYRCIVITDRSGGINVKILNNEIFKNLDKHSDEYFEYKHLFKGKLTYLNKNITA